MPLILEGERERERERERESESESERERGESVWPPEQVSCCWLKSHTHHTRAKFRATRL